MISPSGSVAYVTDLEGQWERLTGFVALSPHVRLEGDRLELGEHVTFVFGGDAIDRGSSSRRIVRTLLDAKERYGARVVLLAGNRDVNKLRLVRELAGFLPERVPEGERRDRATLLRFLFARTMGAPDAFVFRSLELAREGRPAADEAVVESFLEDLAPTGMLTRYLAACQLAYRQGETLFLHGGLTEQSLGYVPGRAPVDDVDGWIESLNAFYRDQLGRFVARSPNDLVDPPWASVVEYQAPSRGRATNPQSVVYGRLADELNNPHLPDAAVMRTLVDAGLRRLVLGHTPCGDTPAVLRTDGFELVVADNSRGRVETGSSVAIEGSSLSIRGRIALDSGELHALPLDTHTDDTSGAVGRRDRTTGRLVKGRLDDGRYATYRGLPGYVLEQLAIEADALEASELEPACDRSSRE